MNKSHLIHGTILIVSLSMLNSFSSSKSMALNSVEKTSELRPVMPYDEVVELLEKPKSSQMNEDSLMTVTPGGDATQYKFSRCGSDCVYFGNTKFALAGPPEC
jgi:hypothetical protein